MAENKPGPMRTVEEPAGFDNPPTERIPAQGDLSNRRTDAEPLDRQADDVRDEQLATRTTDPLEPADDSVKPVERPTDPAGEPTERVTDSTEPPVEPVTDSVESPAVPPAEASADAAIFDESAADRFRNRWRELQAGFVDDPAQAVRAADELVDEIMRELAERRRNIEEQWRGGPDDTEDLRMVIREYRAFFNQLLNS
jgi:hypothetical protein